MARGESTDAWSTREELLLVCAVARFRSHKSWDYIANELQNRSCRSEQFFTHGKCIAMFRHLHKQIIGKVADDDTLINDQTVDYMVEVLKKRRMDELTRDIELINKNIVLLELNFNRLLKRKACTDEAEEEEDEVMVDEEGIEGGGPDPISEGNGTDQVKGYKLRRRRRVRSAKVESHCKKIMKGVLRRLRRHKHISLFERRLPNQKTEEYRKMIRQHMDLETIQSRVNQDHYQHSFEKFFFDILLLVNNAIILFGNNSEELLKALQLRDLVRKEMDELIPNPFRGEAESLLKMFLVVDMTST